jgi:hypothetical protein
MRIEFDPSPLELSADRRMLPLSLKQRALLALLLLRERDGLARPPDRGTVGRRGAGDGCIRLSRLPLAAQATAQLGRRQWRAGSADARVQASNRPRPARC